MQDKFEIQVRYDAGKYGFRIGGMQGVGCRTDRMQDKRDARQDGCRKGGMQERRDAGKEGLGKGMMNKEGMKKRMDSGLERFKTGGRRNT